MDQQDGVCAVRGWGDHRAGQRLEVSLPLLQERRRCLLRPLLHLLLQLRHPGFLPGGVPGPAHQPRERHSLEEDLPPLPGHRPGVCGHRVLPEHLLHHHPRLGPLLPVQLLHLPAALDQLLQRLEHRALCELPEPLGSQRGHALRELHVARHRILGRKRAELERHRCLWDYGDGAPSPPPHQPGALRPQETRPGHHLGPPPPGRPALGAGLVSPARLGHLLLLHLEGDQVHGQGCLFHGHLSLPDADRPPGARNHPARSLPRHPLLPEARPAAPPGPAGVDGRGHPDLLLLRRRPGLPDGPGQLQQVPQQLLQGFHRPLLPEQRHQLRGGLCGLLHPGLHVPRTRGPHFRGGRVWSRAGLHRLPQGRDDDAALPAVVLPLLPHAHIPGAGQPVRVLGVPGDRLPGHVPRAAAAARPARAPHPRHRRPLLPHGAPAGHRGRDVHLPAVRLLRVQRHLPALPLRVRSDLCRLGVRRRPLL